MAKFALGTNNGITAVAPWSVNLRNNQRWQAHRQANDQTPFILEGPIFTFSDLPQLRQFVSGSRAFMAKLQGGHEFVQDSIYVPFSNGIQWGDPTTDAVLDELRFRTDGVEVMQAFGLVVVPEQAHVFIERPRVQWKPASAARDEIDPATPASRIKWHRPPTQPISSRVLKEESPHHYGARSEDRSQSRDSGDLGGGWRFDQVD